MPQISDRPELEPLMTQQQMADWLGVQVRTIQRHRGQGMPSIMVGRQNRYSRPDMPPAPPE